MNVRNITSRFSGGRTSAFNDIWGRWRADTFSGTSPNVILIDKSGNGRNMTQQAGIMTPGTAANGQAKFTGNASTRLENASTITNFPITIVVIGKRPASATCGFFGSQGASPFNTCFSGFETSDRYAFYTAAASAILNTDSGGGSDRCWTTIGGWGARIAFINGIIQTTQLSSSGGIQSSNAVALGTQYRGLNFDWQETLVWNRVLSIAELDEVHTYVNTRYGMSIPLWSSYTKVPTVWMGGQSNMSGRGDRGVGDINIPSPYNVAQPNVNIWFGAGTGNTIGTDFSTLDITANNQMLGDTPSLPLSFVGSETTMGKTYITNHGGSIYIMKWALGSTFLAKDTTANGYWHPTDNTLAPSNTQRAYPKNLVNWWTMMAKMQSNSRYPDIIGIIWFQGEQDGTVQAYANAYAANAQILFSVLGQELGVPYKQIYLCRININDTIVGAGLYHQIVYDQQTSLPSLIPKMTLINTDIYGLRGDGVHINVAGQLAMGQAIAALL